MKQRKGGFSVLLKEMKVQMMSSADIWIRLYIELQIHIYVV